ncbi:uncharacterized protein RCC_08356 [Ramularia collo-cygni]|uniref:Transcription factor Pcc1 n=1 Tax=Ramularia collo-cygni TaxID=112498 RepID=A0A2D3VF13_9PEZI|nr:uncharacterized protein RCC_08356 [Ramularia collo-cygni]CZT22651.1 uncharacterized protein RCC_08356 [Ramularia collo-cygni]
MASASTEMSASASADFPCQLTLHIPFPTPRLASAAHRTLSVDPELSALVQRTFSVVDSAAGDKTILRTDYRATTNRMLRVAVNGFLESLGTVVQVMEELDGDVVKNKGLQDLEGAQGVEVGMVGRAG